MIVYDLYLIDDSDATLIDNKFLAATVFDLDYANFIKEISCKTYDFPFEIVEREIEIPNGNS